MFDVETHGAEDLWRLPPPEFVRLCGWTWNTEDKVYVSDDYTELIEQIRQARYIVGHNIHHFDLTALFGKDSVEPLEMALEGRILDTMCYASVEMPHPSSYVNRHGDPVFIRNLEHAKVWYSLDEIAYQLGVPGKSGSIKEIAKKHGGYGCIPIDDDEYREYLKHDVLASRAVSRAMIQKWPISEYLMREQRVWGLQAQIERSGLRIDVADAEARVAEQEQTRAIHMNRLVERYNFPSEGKAPLRTNAGKAAVLAALDDLGVSTGDLVKTKTGVSLGRDSILAAVAGKGEEAESLGLALAEIGGLRPLAQAALDHLQPDGRIHPQITSFQLSGRWSTQNPGMTTWTSRGDGAREKRYIIPNEDDHVFVEFDLAQADSRIVAALSGDKKFAKRFEPGADAHMITAILMWGQEVVDTDPAGYRQKAKPCNHGGAYGAGAKTLAKTTGLPIETTKRYVESQAEAYPLVTKWQAKVRREAQRTGFVLSEWGRRMPVDKDRVFTQAPALHGQNGTREVMCDGMLRLPLDIMRMIVLQVHDAILLSIPRDRVDEVIRIVKAAFEVPFKPRKGGLRIDFHMTHGPIASNWQEAGH